MRKSCAACRKASGYGQAVHLGAQTIDDFLHADFAFIERLERGVDESAIAAAAAAGIGVYIRHGRVGLDHI